MRSLYNIIIHISGFIVQILAIFNSKLKQGVVGRKETFPRLKKAISSSNKTIWMHCASLGEYEQGLPLLQELKLEYPDHKIVLSFFSPSGYENKKNTIYADVVVYLPLDTKANAKQFLDATRPDLILFVKYEIWPNMLLEIKKRNLKALLISATFRKNQTFFSWYGKLFKKALFAFEHIFTQDEDSKKLILKIGYNSVSVSGDTRFDRVSNQLKTDNTIDFIENFKDHKTTIIFGSSWPEDDALIIPFINNYPSSSIKYIIAPHNVNPNYTTSLLKQIKQKTICFSDLKNKNPKDHTVFILDTIGYLSKAYSYADIAYVGGAVGKTGLHNVLEPAVFGIPIIIGGNYKKFPEAKALIESKGIFYVTNKEELGLNIKSLVENPENQKTQGQINANYIIKNKGAVIHIMDYIRK